MRGHRRVKRLAMSVCMYVCMYVYMCVCVQKTRLFTALLLEDCHEIALNRLVVEYVIVNSRSLRRYGIYTEVVNYAVRGRSPRMA